MLFGAALASPATSYRACRFPWSATPPGRPAIATTTQDRRKLIVYASWNGATNIARWRILAGSSRDTLKPVAETPNARFETTTRVFTSAAYVSVQARDRAGHVLGASNTVKPGAAAA